MDFLSLILTAETLVLAVVIAAIVEPLNAIVRLLYRHKYKTDIIDKHKNTILRSTALIVGLGAGFLWSTALVGLFSGAISTFVYAMIKRLIAAKGKK